MNNPRGVRDTWTGILTALLLSLVFYAIVAAFGVVVWLLV